MIPESKIVERIFELIHFVTNFIIIKKKLKVLNDLSVLLMGSFFHYVIYCLIYIKLPHIGIVPYGRVEKIFK